MQMTDEQVWTDLARFAEAMKRAATVVFDNGITRPCVESKGRGVDFESVRNCNGIREIIEPKQKKIRPLNAEEWKGVAGCFYTHNAGDGVLKRRYDEKEAEWFASVMATCHPPGFPNDIRKLWVEEQE